MYHLLIVVQQIFIYLIAGIVITCVNLSDNEFLFVTQLNMIPQCVYFIVSMKNKWEVNEFLEL